MDADNRKWTERNLDSLSAQDLHEVDEILHRVLSRKEAHERQEEERAEREERERERGRRVAQGRDR